MTEAEWLSNGDLRPMLLHIPGESSDRRLRLFACACCRRLWRFLSDDRSRTAVEMAERFADEQVTQEQLNEASYAAEAAFQDAIGTKAADIAHGAFIAAAPDDYTDPAFVAAETAPHDAANAAATLTLDDGEGLSDEWRKARTTEVAAQSDILRDIFGNPFRPVAFSPEWRTDTAVTLAQQMYDSRDFSAMPILADALQDAGCENPDILQHCRESGPHVRGCWVVDLVLSKE